MMKSFEVTIENKFSAPLPLSNIRTKQREKRNAQWEITEEKIGVN